jgi:hypothetical protein
MGEIMKDATFTLEFISHMLGNQDGPRGEKDHFKRDSRGRIIFQQSWFYSAFNRAIQMTRLRGVKPGDIQMCLLFEAPTQIYRRRYSGRDGREGFRPHEAIMPGTQVTFTAMVADHITETTLSSILERMGQHVGLSPYGYRLGYGRFNVVDIKVGPSDAAEEGQSQPVGSTAPSR